MSQKLEEMLSEYQSKRMQNNISENSKDWLIKQARQVEGLKRKVWELEKELANAREGNQAEKLADERILNKKIKYRLALEEIAETKITPEMGNETHIIIKARKALKENEE